MIDVATITVSFTKVAPTTIVAVDNSPVAYYTLGGVKIEKPIASIFAKRQVSKPLKVVVK